MVHAKLGVGAENSGKLVSEVRSVAAEAAEKEGALHTIGDGPPGTSCPVIASVTGADLVLMVTEPTVSGVHDLERVMELTRHFGVETLVVVNKADLNDEVRRGIYALAEKLGSEVAAEIPFDSAVSAALENGATVLDYEEAGEVADRLRALWKTIAERL
jgi:MinD superfamily P-loop ATPase